MEKLIVAIEEMNRLHPRPNFEIKLTEPFDTNNPWDHSSWPNNALPGVYIFTSSDREVQYIGKASRGIGSRLNAYWRKGKLGETESKSWKSESCRFIYTIGIPKECWFEASAIEAFLISKVQPPRNTVGK